MRKILYPQRPASSLQPLAPRPGWSNARRIIAMRLDNIGDVIMTGPALRAIKASLPEAHLTLMASPGGTQAAPLLPWVDEVLTRRVLWQDLGRLEFDPEREWKLVAALRERGFDAAIIFTSFSQSPHPPAFAAYLAGIPLRAGESKEKGRGVLTDELEPMPDRAHQAERNLRLVEALGFPASDRSLAIQVPTAARRAAIDRLAERGVARGQPFLLLNPWASCQARMYPAQRSAAAARELAVATGWRVLVTGVAADRERGRPVLEALGPYGVDMIGATSLTEMAALVGDARLVLTNNTSTLHMADATRTPMVVLYSGTEYESQWGPRSAPFRLLRQPTACSPCYAFTCPFHLECLDIPPRDVATAGLELLAEVAERRERSGVVS